MRLRLDRRALLRLFASTALSLPALVRGRGQPNDRGIGGTGFVPGDDRGIGGTGVIGTIQRFGSIVVNDLRIAYAPDSRVRVDGRAATLRDLRIGQVVQVAALENDGTFTTRSIDVTSEVVGPVDRLSRRGMIVLGQTISTASITLPNVRRGEVVAVSGLRRNDGVVVASLVERRPGAANRVAGPVEVLADGSPAIGRLALVGIASDLIGRRVLVEGRLEAGRLMVDRAEAASTRLNGVRTLSIESYVERRGETVTLGSGYAVERAGALALPSGRSVRSVVTASLDENGRLTLDSVTAGGRTYGQPSIDAHGSNDPRGGGGEPRRGSGDSPNSRTPMNFGRDGRVRGGMPDQSGGGSNAGAGGFSSPGGAGMGGGAVPGGMGGPGGSPGTFGGSPGGFGSGGRR